MQQQSIKSNRKRSTAAIKFNDTAIDIQYPKDDDQLFIIVDAIMEILTNKDKLSDLIIAYMQ